MTPNTKMALAFVLGFGTASVLGLAFYPQIEAAAQHSRGAAILAAMQKAPYKRLHAIECAGPAFFEECR